MPIIEQRDELLKFPLFNKVLEFLDKARGQTFEKVKQVPETYYNLAKPIPKISSDIAEIFMKAMSNPTNDPATNQAINDVFMVMFPQIGTIKAFHGSPYKFKKFAQEAIGTGEGVQAFGYGHYFTDNPEIAKHYAKSSLGQGTLEIPSAITDADIFKSVNKHHENPKLFYDLVRQFDGDVKKALNFEYADTGFSKGTKRIIEELGIKPVSQEYLYKTHLMPGKKLSEYEHKLVDWTMKVPEEYLGKVKSEVAGRLKDSNWVKVLGFGDLPTGYTTENLYRKLENYYGSKEASAILSRAGIIGIRYPSGTLSGIKNSPYYNYVIFNPEDIKIKKVIPLK